MVPKGLSHLLISLFLSKPTVPSSQTLPSLSQLCFILFKAYFTVRHYQLYKLACVCVSLSPATNAGSALTTTGYSKYLLNEEIHECSASPPLCLLSFLLILNLENRFRRGSTVQGRFHR